MCKLGFSASPRVGCGQIPTWEAAWRLNSWVNKVLAQKWGSAEGFPFSCCFWYFLSRPVMGGGGGGGGGTAVAAGGHQVEPCIRFTYVEWPKYSNKKNVSRGRSSKQQTNSKRSYCASSSVWVDIDLPRRSWRPGHRIDLRDCRCCRLCLRLQLLVLRLLWSLLWDVWIWRPSNTKEPSRSRTSIDIR